MFRYSIAALIALFLLAGAAQSQTGTFATITGTVRDASGAVVPHAAVSTKNEATGITTATKSNDLGIYTLPQLLEGSYSVTAGAAGFKESVIRGVVPVARDYRRLDITLEIGAAQSRIEVTSGATLIETETARIGNTQNGLMLKAMPTNDPGIWPFLALSPDLLEAGNGSSQLRFAGSIANQYHFAIDGTTMSYGSTTENQIGPLGNFRESFQEFRIDVANNTAEFGTIGQVTLITKSGTNSLHGSVFDLYTTPWFRARNPFALQRTTGVTHNLGASLGGPVYLPGVYELNPFPNRQSPKRSKSGILP